MWPAAAARGSRGNVDTKGDDVGRSYCRRPRVLDYQAASGRGSRLPAKIRWMLLVSVAFHLVTYGLYAVTLDGGATARRCAAVALGYWLTAALVIWRHGHKPSWVDLLFIGFGYPVMLAVTETIVEMGWTIDLRCW